MRVILGAAFGVDRVAAAVVDERFRGRGASASEDAGTAARPRSLPGSTAWRIETVVPAPLTLAAEAAWSDFASNREGAPGADDRAAYADDWRKVLARSDSVTELPASWRRNADGPVAGAIEGLEHFPPFAPADRLGPDYRLSYVEAANFQLQQIDMLVAIWDGEPARGPGGVAEVAAHAHEAGIPVVFIDAAVPERPPAMLRSIEFGPERRNIVGWSPQALKAVLEPADCRDAALADAVRSIVQLPAHDSTVAEDAGHATPELTIADFYDEGRSAPSPARSYARLVRLLGGAPRRHPGEAQPDVRRSEGGWRGWANAVDDDGALHEELLTILQRRYATVSTLANIYASRYRSAFVSAFSLGAIAGLVAVIGLAFGVSPDVKIILILIELVVVCRIFQIVWNGKRRKYHAKYIAYRTLCEALHSLRFLCAFGLAPRPQARAAGHYRWHDWYVDCTVREMSLPNRALDATYQRRILKTVMQHEISTQIAYHEQNARLMLKVDRSIHRIGNGLFVSVILALLGLLALGAGSPQAHSGNQARSLGKSLLTTVAAFFPAAGSALAGIRFMGDFDSKAMHSTQMAGVLRDMATRTARALRKQDFYETRAILRDLATVLSEDIKLFRTVYSHRELVLPS